MAAKLFSGPGDERIGRALCLVAHPDDIDFFAAGTVLLLTFDPTPGYRQHPDHRVIGRVALDAAWPCARDPLTYPEMGPPHETAEAWLFGGPPGARVDLRIDVGELLDAKIDARLEHRSQTGDPAVLRRRWRRVGREERFAQVDLR